MTAEPVLWLARRTADGPILGGLVDEADPLAWTTRATPRGWKPEPGHSPPPRDLAGEALTEAFFVLVWMASEAGLMHTSVDEPGSDAPGPWRIEVAMAVLLRERGD